MSIRRDPVYLSSDVWRALWLLSKYKNLDSEIVTAKCTPDELADDILREVIKDKYPQIFKHQKRIDEMEEILIKTLQ